MIADILDNWILSGKLIMEGDNYIVNPSYTIIVEIDRGRREVKSFSIDLDRFTDIEDIDRPIDVIDNIGVAFHR